MQARVVCTAHACRLRREVHACAQSTLAHKAGTDKEFRSLVQVQNVRRRLCVHSHRWLLPGTSSMASCCTSASPRSEGLHPHPHWGTNSPASYGSHHLSPCPCEQPGVQSPDRQRKSEQVLLTVEPLCATHKKARWTNHVFINAHSCGKLGDCAGARRNHDSMRRHRKANSILVGIGTQQPRGSGRNNEASIERVALLIERHKLAVDE